MRARMLALGAGLGLLACGPDDGATSDEPAENVIHTAVSVLPPDEAYGGKSLEDWAVEFMRWHYAWTSAQCLNAENDQDGSRCTFNQPEDSPVFFFASSDYSTSPDTVVNRTLCKVPAGKAILVPISFFAEDDAGSTEDELRAPADIEEVVDEIHETMRNLTLTADQNAVEDLARYSVGPKAFDLSIGEAPNWHTCAGVDAENTTISPVYFAGYFVLVEPPTPGNHRLEYSSVYTGDEGNQHRRVNTLFEVAER